MTKQRFITTLFATTVELLSPDLVAHGVLWVGLEPGLEIPWLELAQEPLVSWPVGGGWGDPKGSPTFVSTRDGDYAQSNVGSLPEEADVGNWEQNHGQPLQSQPKGPCPAEVMQKAIMKGNCPSTFRGRITTYNNICVFLNLYIEDNDILHSRVRRDINDSPVAWFVVLVQDALLHNTASQNLEPLAIEKYFELVRGLCIEVSFLGIMPHW